MKSPFFKKKNGSGPRNDLKRKRAFTLVEAVIYVTLLALLLVAMVNMFLTMAKSWTSIRIDKDMAYSASTALERMTREIRDADSVNSAGSIFGTVSPGQLVLNVHVSGNQGQFTKFLLVGSSTLDIAETTGTTSLILPETSVTNLTFQHIVTPQSEAVRINMQLKSTYNGESKTANFYTTAIVRDSYQN